MASKTIIGAVIRYNDDLLSSSKTTVDEHNKLLRKKGMVWFGKFGIPIRAEALKFCTAPDMELKLILVRSRRSDRPRIFIAPVRAAQNKRPNLALIPEYYRTRLGIDTWFCLSGEIRAMKATELTSWAIASSRQPISNTTKRSSQSFFWAAKQAQAVKVHTLLCGIVYDNTRRRRAQYTLSPDISEADAIPRPEDLDNLNESFLEQDS